MTGLHESHTALPLSRAAFDQLGQEALGAGATSPAAGLRLAHDVFARAQAAPDQTLRARASLTLGQALNRAERYAEALETLSGVEPVLESLGRSSDLAVCRWQIGLASRFLRTDQTFAEKLEKALADLLAAGLEVEAARCRRDLAAAYNWQGNYPGSAQQTAQAREFFAAHGLRAEAAMCAFAECARLRWAGQFTEALAILRDAEEVFAQADLPVEQATLWLYQGSVGADSMQFDLALPLLRKAQAEFERLDLPARLALCRNEMGRLALHRGRLQQAETAYQSSLAAFRSLGMRADLALALHNLANVRHYQGEPGPARRLYAQASAEFHAVGNRLYAALCELNLGAAEREMGRYGAALRHLERARAAMSDLGAAGYVALAHHNLGRTWLDLGDPAQAAHHLSTARQAYQAIGAPFPAARSLVQLALAEAPDRALGHIQAARQACQAAGAEGYLAACDQAAGEVQANAGNYTEALPLLISAETAFASLAMPINALACRILQADCYLAVGESERARALYRAALALAEEALPDLAWRCAAGLAQVQEGQSRPDDALAWHRRAVAALGQARRTLHHEVLVDAFLGRRLAALERAVGAALQAGDAATALTLCEESRAQLLSLRLGGARPLPDAAAAGRLQALRREVAELRHRLGMSLEADWSILRPPDPEQQSLLAELERKAREYHRLTALAEAAESESQPVVFSLAALRAGLSCAAPAGWTCLAYHWSGDRLCIFLVTDTTVEVIQRDLRPLDHTALDLCTAPEPDRRRLMYREASPRDGGDGRPTHVGAAHLKRLHDLLLPGALSDRLSPDHRLAIIPAGRLHSLPFHALHDGDAYLCERATLICAPSLAALGVCLKKAAAFHAPTGGALIVAVEDFGGSLPCLPHAGREAGLVKRFFHRASLLQDTAATREAVQACLEQPGRRDAIHFATHAVFEAQLGRLSRLVLHGGDMQADDIEQMKLDARLVVLSACQSGLGQVHRGEEIVGLTQAFFLAGAPSVVASLWPVDDPATAEFMADFYAGFAGEGCSPACALAIAQRRWIAGGRPPYTWAAFGAYGAP